MKVTVHSLLGFLNSVSKWILKDWNNFKRWVNSFFSLQLWLCIVRFIEGTIRILTEKMSTSGTRRSNRRTHCDCSDDCIDTLKETILTPKPRSPERQTILTPKPRSTERHPRLVLSVVGDSSSFVPKPWLTPVFQLGLIETAKGAKGN
jgi:hypothetical protein